MEKRHFIFIDHKGIVIHRTTHDSSIIHSLPRSGDEVYDYTSTTETGVIVHTISGIVHRIAFDYMSNSINIYVKID